MATWDVNWWPWGGVTLCFDEREIKVIENADDAASAVAAALALAPAGPVQVAGAVLGVFLQAEKAIMENVDQGNGVCFLLNWVVMGLGQWWAIIPSPRPVPSAGQQHVNFIGNDRMVYELVWKDAEGRWSSTNLTQAAGTAVTAAAGSPLDGYSTAGQQHVNFIGNDRMVYELVWKDADGRWSITDLTQAAGTGVTAAAGSPLDGYSTAGQQHVNFIGNDGMVYELVWKDADGRWSITDLTEAAGTAVTAAAGSPLDALDGRPAARELHRRRRDGLRAGLEGCRGPVVHTT